MRSCGRVIISCSESRSESTGESKGKLSLHIFQLITLKEKLKLDETCNERKEDVSEKCKTE